MTKVVAKATTTEKREVSINEAMSILRQLKERHSELCSLRNENSAERTRFIGANADRQEIKKPVYDIRHLDKIINQVAKEIRILDLAIKATNQSVLVVGYKFNEDVFGQVE